MDPIISDSKQRLRILVVIASYGTANDPHLSRVIDEYKSMSFDIDLVILSNINKVFSQEIEVIVGLPTRNPWSLPFAHKKIFADRLTKYDLFVYSEDDILISELNIRAFLEVSDVLPEDEIAGFFVAETGSGKRTNYPQAHYCYRWHPNSVRSRGRYTFAFFSNEHACCYALTRRQLRRAIESGGFLVKPHDWKYDLLCSAATDPYTQCGFVKLIPISHFDDFTVHHLPGKYVGKLGVDGPSFRRQIDALMRIGADGCTPAPLFSTETKLKRGMYSKDCYEPPCEPILSMLPEKARTVLSIGCGWGATECRLIDLGLRVVAVPVDPIICCNAAENGVEIVCGDAEVARAKLVGRKFDCILYLNVLHLFTDPLGALTSFGDAMSDDGVAIIQAPNMLYYSRIWRYLRSAEHMLDLKSYGLTGLHFTSDTLINHWCKRAGLKVNKTVRMSSLFSEPMDRIVPSFVKSLTTSQIITIASRS